MVGAASVDSPLARPNRNRASPPASHPLQPSTRHSFSPPATHAPHC